LAKVKRREYAGVVSYTINNFLFNPPRVSQLIS